MLKIVDRYIVRHLLVSYGICLASILGIFLIIDILTNVERLLSRGSFLSALGGYLVAATPVAYYQIAPGAFLMAAMFTLSSLNKTNELLALRASGVSIYRVIQPIVIASLDASCQNGDLAVLVTQDGEAMIKLIYYKGEELLLRSTNSAYPERRLPRSEVLHLHPVVYIRMGRV